jgi:hypothetical protein
LEVTTYAKTGRYTKLHFLVAFLANWQNEPKVGYHKESSGLGGDPETGPGPNSVLILHRSAHSNDAPQEASHRLWSGTTRGHAEIFCPQHAANLKRAGDEWRFISGINFVPGKPADYTAGGLVNLMRMRTFAPFAENPVLIVGRAEVLLKGHSRQRRPDAKQWQGTEQSSRCS